MSSFLSSSTHAPSPHDDVLSAVVSSQLSDRIRLRTELKNRAKGAVQAGVYPDAIRLYTKALTTIVDDNSGSTEVEEEDKDSVAMERAILYANRSMMYGKMNDHCMAKDDAIQATQYNPQYVKGWWRLGQATFALQDFSAAIRAYENAIALESNNKVLQKELQKCRQTAADAAATAAAAVTASSSSSSADDMDIETKPSHGSKETSSTSSSLSSNNKYETIEKDWVVATETEGVKFKPSEHVKGYKIVNGKKTTYFHQEISEDAKKLIGDIAPKKIDPTILPTSSSTQSNGVASMDSNNKAKSVWNQAGTWEEKDVTSWALDSFREKLLNVTFILPESSPAPHALITIVDDPISTKVSGHASVATVRGKTRYIYELSVLIHWSFQHAMNKDHVVTAEGTMSFPDVDGTHIIGDSYDACDFVIKSATDNTIRPVVTRFVLDSGLRDELHRAFDEWVELFRTTY
jgi:tetratricopeptide (TPR) repeat protein